MSGQVMQKHCYNFDLLSEALPSGMLLNTNANGMTSLRKDARRRDICLEQSTDCVPYRANLSGHSLTV